MKIYISTDMEGATGIVRPEQVTAGEEEYSFGREMQLNDLQAAAEGAFKGGASEVRAGDSHSRMINLAISQMDERIRLVSGSPRHMGMIEGIEDCDGAFFVAYHAMAGTRSAVLDHTISTVVHSLRINGSHCGELALNAAVCSYYDIPVALITGDEAVCTEGEEFFQKVVTVPVKSGRSQFSAVLINPKETFCKISMGAQEAIRLISNGEAKTPLFELPYRLEITFQLTSQCDAASVMTSSRRLNGRTVCFEGNDLLDMRRQASAAIDLAETVPCW